MPFIIRGIVVGICLISMASCDSKARDCDKMVAFLDPKTAALEQAHKVFIEGTGCERYSILATQLREIRASFARYPVKRRELTDLMDDYVRAIDEWAALADAGLEGCQTNKSTRYGAMVDQIATIQRRIRNLNTECNAKPK